MKIPTQMKSSKHPTCTHKHVWPRSSSVVLLYTSSPLLSSGLGCTSQSRPLPHLSNLTRPQETRAFPPERLRSCSTDMSHHKELRATTPPFPDTPDPLLHRSKRDTDHAGALATRTALAHIDKGNSYVRRLLNTISPQPSAEVQPLRGPQSSRHGSGSGHSLKSLQRWRWYGAFLPSRSSSTNGACRRHTASPRTTAARSYRRFMSAPASILRDSFYQRTSGLTHTLKCATLQTGTPACSPGNRLLGLPVSCLLLVLQGYTGVTVTVWYHWYSMLLLIHLHL